MKRILMAFLLLTNIAVAEVISEKRKIDFVDSSDTDLKVYQGNYKPYEWTVTMKGSNISQQGYTPFIYWAVKTTSAVVVTGTCAWVTNYVSYVTNYSGTNILSTNIFTNMVFSSHFLPAKLNTNGNFVYAVGVIGSNGNSVTRQGSFQIQADPYSGGGLVNFTGVIDGGMYSFAGSFSNWPFLSRSSSNGSTRMSSDIDMGGNSITNVGNNSVKFANGAVLSPIQRWTLNGSNYALSAEISVVDQSGLSATQAVHSGILATNYVARGDTNGWVVSSHAGFVTASVTNGLASISYVDNATNNSDIARLSKTNNFIIRPQANGTNVLLQGEAAAQTNQYYVAQAGTAQVANAANVVTGGQSNMIATALQSVTNHIQSYTTITGLGTASTSNDTDFVSAYGGIYHANAGNTWLFRTVDGSNDFGVAANRTRMLVSGATFSLYNGAITSTVPIYINNDVVLTDNSDIARLSKTNNFIIRPQANGTNVLLQGEAAAQTNQYYVAQAGTAQVANAANVVTGGQSNMIATALQSVTNHTQTLSTITDAGTIASRSSNDFYLASNPNGYISSPSNWSSYIAFHDVDFDGWEINDMPTLRGDSYVGQLGLASSGSLTNSTLYINDDGVRPAFAFYLNGLPNHFTIATNRIYSAVPIYVGTDVVLTNPLAFLSAGTQYYPSNNPAGYITNNTATVTFGTINGSHVGDASGLTNLPPPVISQTFTANVNAAGYALTNASLVQATTVNVTGNLQQNGTNLTSQAIGNAAYTNAVLQSFTSNLFTWTNAPTLSAVTTTGTGFTGNGFGLTNVYAFGTPQCYVYLSTNLPLSANTETIVPAQFVFKDTHSGYSTSTLYYTIPVAYTGLWQVSAGAGFIAPNANSSVNSVTVNEVTPAGTTNAVAYGNIPTKTAGIPYLQVNSGMGMVNYTGGTHKIYFSVKSSVGDTNTGGRAYQFMNINYLRGP